MEVGDDSVGVRDGVALLGEHLQEEACSVGLCLHGSSLN